MIYGPVRSSRVCFSGSTHVQPYHIWPLTQENRCSSGTWFKTQIADSWNKPARGTQNNIILDNHSQQLGHVLVRSEATIPSPKSSLIVQILLDPGKQGTGQQRRATTDDNRRLDWLNLYSDSTCQDRKGDLWALGKYQCESISL